MSLPDDLLTSHALLDAQHEEIFDRIEGLKEALEHGIKADDLRAVVDYLHDYTVDHFRLEELIMRSLYYPGYAKQRTAHESFWRTVLGLRMECEDAGYSAASGWKVYDTVSAWVRNHIQQEDLELARWLKARAPQSSGDSAA